MKKRKNNTGVILLAIITIALIALLILILTGKIEFNNKTTNSIDYDELAKISKGDYNYVKSDYSNDYSLIILSTGKVLVNFDEYIANISNAKDLIVFSGAGTDELAYILTTDGNVYKYKLTDFASKKYNATKIDKYSNIESILRYQTRKGNAGGCDYVILVDSKGKYYSLDSFCV